MSYFVLVSISLLTVVLSVKYGINLNYFLYRKHLVYKDTLDRQETYKSNRLVFNPLAL